jgi:putative transposase
VLGLREGATENTAVVSELLQDLAARELDFSVPCLYVLDGGKALAVAARRHAGEAALIRAARCTSGCNVIDHFAGGAQAVAPEETAECLRHDRIRRRPTCAGTIAS